MGESACLMRSFSHPSDVLRELREGDPMRALTESVSFGRYMSESLDWEKWSTFSRNRHLEEVEKFAKPGSVAEKKAYFEAHYRKKTVKKEEPESHTEEENETCTEQTPECSPISTIQFQPEFATKEMLVSSDEQMKEEHSTVVVADSTDHFNDPNPTIEKSKLEVVEPSSTESSEENLVAQKLTQHEEKSTQHEEKSTGFDGPESDGCANSLTSQEEKMSDKRISSSSGEKGQKVSSSKLLTRSKPSKLLLSDAKETKSIQRRKGYNDVRSKEKPVLNSSEKKKSAPKFLHMSINFASSNVGPSKAISPVLKQIKKIKDITTASLKLQRGSLVSRKTPARASVDLKPKLTSVDFKSKGKLTSVIEASETKRIKTLQNKIATGGSKAVKSSNFHSKENSKPPSANAVKPQPPPIVCSPFRFRSEERAAKRKEFFQKQEEKKNSNDSHGSCKKTPARSQSPRLTPKPLQSTGQDTKCRPPRKISSNAKESFSMKAKTNSNNRSMRASSVMPLPRNTVHENASPNIQR